MPRNTELPEGTDHIITGAMETDPAAGAGAGGGTAVAASGDTGFVASGGGTGGTGGTASVAETLRTQAQSLRGEAGDRVREFATSGKTRATDALEELSRVVADAADSIDERLGNEYGEYARRASDAVSGFADTLRGKEVDELYEDVRGAVRKSPGIAVGVAAVLGFTLVRLAKAGLADNGTGGGQSGSGRKNSGSNDLKATPGSTSGAAGTGA
jgi:hypothetical protein